MPNPSFDRARRFGCRAAGFPLAVYLSGLIAAAILILLVLLIPILFELLAGGGTLNAPNADRAALRQLGVEPSLHDKGSDIYEHHGLLPTVWRLRKSWIGPAYVAVYRSFPPVRNNHLCLLVIVVAGCLLIILAGCALVWLETSVHRGALRAATTLRRQIHDQSQRLGSSDLFVGQRTSERELFTDDVTAVRRGLVAWWRMVPHGVVFFVAMLALAFSVNFWLTLTTALLVALLWWIFNEARRRLLDRELLLTAAAAERFLSPVLEHLEQHRAIANLASDLPSERRQFDEALQRHDDAALAREATAARVMPLMTIFVLLGASFVVLLAGYNVLGEPPRVSLPEAVLLGVALCAIGYPFYRFERLLEMLPSADEAAERIFVYLDREPRVGQLPHAIPLEHAWRQIAFQNVTLADMEGRLLLDGVSFALPHGSQSVIFCSDDATGRAIAALLTRFCDPAAGRVLFDKQDLAHVTLHSARNNTAVVLSNHLLTSGSLRENVVGAVAEATASQDARIIDALKQVHAYEFVQSMPEGLETPLGSQGMTLSVGQGIRLALARTVMQNPNVLVIEEPRDDLDQVTAERVADALEKIGQNRTLVILARRLATLRAAQRILFFHDGRLLAVGDHQELLHTNDIYRHLNYVRFNEFRDSVK
ncbi:MAG: ABC transporter ATP-binding protein [Pirellulales bacterium]|nr:ABC transporter ATP-binding protein [Pirellulales bacterium]